MAETQQQLETLNVRQILAIVTRTAAANALGIPPTDSAEVIAFATRRANLSPADMQRLARKLLGLEALAAKAAARKKADLDLQAAEQRVRELDPLGEAMRARDEAKRQAFIAKDAERELEDVAKELVRTDGCDLAELQSFVDALKQQLAPAGSGAPTR